MNSVNSHYPDYDVMEHSGEWDSHTKEIVRKRLGPFPEHKFLSPKEARYLTLVAQHLVYDNREDILNWIVYHFDKTLSSEIGESERKVKVPPEACLIREGLKALDHVSRLAHAKDFGELSTQDQFAILASLQLGKAPIIPEWEEVPQKDLFNKLVSETVAAYYSHPLIWSEIGYGGPMYPKSYVRIEFGLTDPWEAKQDGE